LLAEFYKTFWDVIEGDGLNMFDKFQQGELRLF
jgi:hypothetical protein